MTLYLNGVGGYRRGAYTVAKESNDSTTDLINCLKKVLAGVLPHCLQHVKLRDQARRVGGRVQEDVLSERGDVCALHHLELHFHLYHGSLHPHDGVGLPQHLLYLLALVKGVILELDKERLAGAVPNI